MADGKVRSLAAGMAILAAGCAAEPHWLEASVPLVEAMNPQVAWMHGVEPRTEFSIGPMEERPGVAAVSIPPHWILLGPVIKEGPRSQMLWAVTHELAHLYGQRLALPWPFSIYAKPLEEARVELVAGDLLPCLEPAARRMRHGIVRWMVDQVRAARPSDALRPSREGSTPRRYLWSRGHP